MTAFPVSASGPDRPAAAEPVWIRGVNWLGDSVMALPAVAAFRRAHPGVRLLMGVRAPLREFWTLCPAVDEILVLPTGAWGDFIAARDLRRRGVSRAYVLPNSFRSAWVPFLAGIPERIGLAGRARRFLLTRVAHPVSYSSLRHQALDYFPLLGVDPGPGLPGLEGLLRVPEAAKARMEERIRAAAVKVPVFPAAPGSWIAVAPGAARGGSKRWPAEHFAAAAAEIVRTRGGGVIVCGTAAEREAGDRVAAAVPGAAINLAGTTTLTELAALFRLCRLALCNDSGSMHLAAAAGIPVVAVFGLTDPERTGPLGRGHAVLRPAGARGDAVIARESAAAAAALASVRPESAAAAAIRILDENRG